MRLLEKTRGEHNRGELREPCVEDPYDGGVSPRSWPAACSPSPVFTVGSLLLRIE
jgi:hypothetical protein